MKLISMTDFVLKESTNKEVCKNFSGFSDIVNNKRLSYDNILKYANFLKQPLELWMFIPCDEEGNILVNYNLTEYDREMYFEEEKKYQQAKERCLFEGFKIIDMPVENQTWKNVVSDEISINIFWFSKERKKWELSKGIKIIEGLSKYNHLILTPTAIKKIEL